MKKMKKMNPPYGFIKGVICCTYSHEFLIQIQQVLAELQELCVDRHNFLNLEEKFKKESEVFENE